MISEDKTQNREYTIKVTKTMDFQKSNTNLEVLAIEGSMLDPSFDNHTTEYKTEIQAKTDSVNIFAVPENEKASVQIIGNDYIKEGNNIVIVNVTAQDGITKREYKINVYKRNNEEEIKHEEEQKNQEEKLEEAYNIQKIHVITEKERITGSETKWSFMGSRSYFGFNSNYCRFRYLL